MPIEVFCVDNLFGSNEHYEFPNALPNEFKDQKTLALKPRMSGYFSGTIALKGGHGNFCKYKGIYFQLRKLRLLNADDDVKNERWQYALVRDMWVNTVLTKDIEVVGDIACWNDDNQLTKEINKTSGMLERPAEIYRIPFKTSTGTKGYSPIQENTAKFKPIGNKGKGDRVLSRSSFKHLTSKLKELKGFKTASKYLYPRRKDIYIFGFIEPTPHLVGGKQKVVERINKAHAEITTDPKRVLVNVSYPTQGNRLLNHIAVSYDGNGIGQAATGSKYLLSLDLSNVTDIREVKWMDLGDVDPQNKLTRDSAIFDIPDRGRYEKLNKTYKLSRKFYAPFGDPKEGSHYFSGVFGVKEAPRYIQGWKPDIKGQKIEIKDYGKPGKSTEGYFYGLDRIDFALTGYAGKNFAQDSSFSAINIWDTWQILKARIQTPIVKYISTGFQLLSRYGKDVAKTEAEQAIAENRTPWTYVYQYRPIAVPWAGDDKTTDKENIWEKLDKSPPYGLLMGQTQRDYEDWDRCQYTGRDPISSLYGYSGIDLDTFKQTYTDGSKWGSDLSGTQIGNLCGDELFSKFFLDLDYFAWVYFCPKTYYDYGSELPGTSGYNKPNFNRDIYGLGKFFGHLPYKHQYAIPVAAGVGGGISKNGKLIQQTPGQKDRYSKNGLERTEKIRKVMLLSALDLKDVGKELAPNKKEDFTIKQGDFFCSSLEYHWSEGDSRIGEDRDQAYTGIKDDQITITRNTLEDFIDSENDLLGEQKELDLDDLGRICLCSNYEGEIEIRTISSFKYRHTLSKDLSQGVKSVDGFTEKLITYGHLKNTGVSFKDLDEAQLIGEQEDKFIIAFYESLGYRIQQRRVGDETIAFWNWLTDEDLRSNQGHLFELVGSDGYAYLRNNDEVHFIYKYSDPEKRGVIASQALERTTIDREKIPEKLKESSLTAKINQVNILFFETEAIPIKTKFLFSKKEEIDTPFYVSYKAVPTDNKVPDDDYYLVKIDSEWDIYDQIISTPKAAMDITKVGDPIAYESLKLSQNYERDRHALKRQFLSLDQRLVDIHAARADGDLNFEDQKKTFNFAMGLMGDIWNIGMTFVSPQVGLAMAANSQEAAAKGIIGGFLTDNKKLVDVSTKQFFNNRKVMMKHAKTMTQASRRKAYGGILSMVDTIGDYVFGGQEYAERTKRIQEDKDIASRQVALNTIGADLSHFEEMQQKTLHMNSLANQHYQESINEYNLSQFLKENRNIDKNNKIYLMTMIPSEKQLRYVEDYRKHFGVECDIPDQKIILRSGMTPNIIRFRNIDEGGINGITDAIERLWLKAKLLAQVKIIGEEKRLRPVSFFDYELAKPIVVVDPKEAKTTEGLRVALVETNRLFEIFKDLQHDKNSEESLKKDLERLKELKQEVQEKADKIKEITENDPYTVNPYGDNPTDVIDRFITLTQALLDGYKEKDELNKAKDKAEDERDQCREETTKAHNKERELLARAEQAERNVAELQKKVADCEQEREALEAVEEELEEEQAKGEELKQKLIKLAAINNNGVKFARNMGYKTAPVASSNFDYSEEQIKEITDNTDKIVKDFSSSKVEFERLQKELEKCKKKPGGSVSTCDENATCGSFKDLIRFLHDMNYDLLKVYDTVTKLPFYGFTPYEFWDAFGVATLQFLHQTIDELKALEEDDVSFLPKQNEDLKIYLLTDTGQKLIKRFKRFFANFGIQSFVRARKLEADIRKEQILTNPENLSFVENLVGSNLTFETEEKIDANVSSEGESEGYEGDGTKGNSIGKEPAGGNVVYTLRGFKNLFFNRYTAPGYRNLYDGNHIYQSFAYYDLYAKGPEGTPSQFFWAAMNQILNTDKRYTSLNERYLGANIFAVKPKNGAINVGKYEGFSDKLYRPLYPLYLFYILGPKKEVFKLSEGKLCCSSVSLGNMENVLKIGNYWGSMGKISYFRLKYSAEVLYRVLCEDEEGDVAEEEVAPMLKQEGEEDKSQNFYDS